MKKEFLEKIINKQIKLLDGCLNEGKTYFINEDIKKLLTDTIKEDYNNVSIANDGKLNKKILDKVNKLAEEIYNIESSNVEDIKNVILNFLDKEVGINDFFDLNLEIKKGDDINHVDNNLMFNEYNEMLAYNDEKEKSDYLNSLIDGKVANENKYSYKNYHDSIQKIDPYLNKGYDKVVPNVNFTSWFANPDETGYLATHSISKNDDKWVINLEGSCLPYLMMEAIKACLKLCYMDKNNDNLISYNNSSKVKRQSFDNGKLYNKIYETRFKNCSKDFKYMLNELGNCEPNTFRNIINEINNDTLKGGKLLEALPKYITKKKK